MQQDTFWTHLVRRKNTNVRPCDLLTCKVEAPAPTVLVLPPAKVKKTSIFGCIRDQSFLRFT